MKQNLWVDKLLTVCVCVRACLPLMVIISGQIFKGLYVPNAQINAK